MARHFANVIVKPGKRPGKRLSTSRVFGPKFMKGKKSGMADLNLTPMVDMFTMLVIYLIQQFAATGEILYMQKDISLPTAAHTQQIEPVPVVQVSASLIALQGERVVDMDDLARDEYLNIPVLEEKLRDQKKRLEMVRGGDDDAFKGDVNIQSDRQVPFKVIKRVMYSCAAAGYGNINFAVTVGGATVAQAAEKGSNPTPTTGG